MRNLITTYFICVFSLLALAQDNHLSLYDAAPISLNPAMTGVFEGDWRIHGQYRSQWKSVNFKPYQAALISFDIPVKKWGFGLQINNFRAGIGNFNAIQGIASVAYTTSIDKNKNHNLSFGVQGGITQKSVEYQLLSFNNQYTTNNGGEFDMSISSQEDFAGQSLVIPAVNAGFLYFFAKKESKMNPFIGFSAFNLTEPKESFIDPGAENKLPMRFYGHLGTRINWTELFYTLPKVLVMNQRTFWEQTYALDAGYYLKGSDLYLLGGGLFRTVGLPVSIKNEAAKIHEDAMVLYLGAKMEDITVKVGYDVNVSSLSTVSSGRGGFEISVTYVNRKKKPSTEKICPRI